MFQLVRKLLFLLPPERAHYFTMDFLNLLVRIPLVTHLIFPKQKSEASISFCGLHFRNRVGLAAGFDKNAKYLHVLSKMGFGHIEVGTVTPLAQDGNPKPRLFRLPKDQALINRMGFNNEGVDAMVTRLKNRPKGLVIGGNIGKNKVTPNENAHLDYLVCFEKLFPYVDYFTVNVSSPNTPGLRELQDKEPLTQLLQSIVQKREGLLKGGEGNKPILLKIAPDMTNEQLKEIAEVIQQVKLDGIILNNTSVDRSALITDKNRVDSIGNGGLSGAPISQRSQEVLVAMSQYLPKDFPIIGVGGIMNEKDGEKRIEAGAQLIQIYTGFVYGGMGLVKKLGKL